jgi:hypothetical protein
MHDAHRAFLVSFALALSAGALACSGGGNAPANAPSTDPSSAGASDAGGAPAVDAASCPMIVVPQPTGSQAFHSLSASVVDTSGAVVSDVPVTVCGFDLCLSGQVSADGSVHVANSEADHPLEHPAFKLGDGVTFAELAYPLPDQTDLALGKTVAVRLPAPAEGAPLVAGASARQGDVVLTMQPGTAIGIDILVYPPDAQGLRVVSVPLVNGPLAIDPSQHLEAVYAMAPQGTTFCPPAALDLPNAPKWSAGTAVEILAHGVDLEQRWAPYAGWAVVANAVVSDDGLRIRTPAGEGLPILSAIGVRKKP